MSFEEYHYGSCGHGGEEEQKQEPEAAGGGGSRGIGSAWMMAANVTKSSWPKPNSEIKAEKEPRKKMNQVKKWVKVNNRYSPFETDD